MLMAERTCVFCRHAQAQCVEVSLQPGDALFLPEGWWHQVDSTGEGTDSSAHETDTAASGRH